jgi:hypothetical protein
MKSSERFVVIELNVYSLSSSRDVSNIIGCFGGVMSITIF